MATDTESKPATDTESKPVADLLSMSLDDLIKQRPRGKGAGSGKVRGRGSASAKANGAGGRGKPKRAASERTHAVYVSNLKYGAGWKELKDHMKADGKLAVARADVGDGDAIVEYETAEDALTAIAELNEKEFLGRPLHITAYAAQELASPRAKASTANGSSGRAIQVTKASKQQGAKGFRVSVTNLPYDITSAELRDIFASVGRVVACVVNPPGHGTVTYANSQLAVAAVRDFDNAKVNHRPITVARLN